MGCCGIYDGHDGSGEDALEWRGGGARNCMDAWMWYISTSIRAAQ